MGGMHLHPLAGFGECADVPGQGVDGLPLSVEGSVCKM